MTLPRIIRVVVLVLMVVAFPAAGTADGPYVNAFMANPTDAPSPYLTYDVIYDVADGIRGITSGMRPSAPINLVEDETDARGGADPDADVSPLNKKQATKPDKVLALKKRIIEIQNQGKLGFRKVVLCSKVDSYGVYSPLPKGKLARKMVIYCEPTNVSTMVTKDRYIVDCTVDFIVLNAAHKPIAGKKGFTKIHRIARSPVLDLFFGLKFQIDKKVSTLLKKGFTLRVILHDNIKNQSAGYNLNLRLGKKQQDPV